MRALGLLGGLLYAPLRVHNLDFAPIAAAQTAIPSCAEIGLLVGPADRSLPVFDSTTLHAAAAVDWICA